MKVDLRKIRSRQLRREPKHGGVSKLMRFGFTKVAVVLVLAALIGLPSTANASRANLAKMPIGGARLSASVTSDPSVFAFGSATYQGSTGTNLLNYPIVGIAPTKSGNGYWEAASDGGVFTFGDAQFFGSMGAVTLNRPVVGIAATPSGNGYWMVASDGSVYSFGGAPSYGSEAGVAMKHPITAMAVSPGGAGYLLAAQGYYNSPAPLTPSAGTWAPGAGRWTPIGPTLGGAPVEFSTWLSPAPGVPAASVVLIEQGQTRAALYAGYDQPSGTWTYSTSIDPSLRPSLVASFNSGFRLDASQGGFYQDGIWATPLVNGAASLVIHNDGSVNIGQWGRDVSMSPSVSEVRQNLSLLVDGNRPAPNVGNIAAWGLTVGNVTNTWRSGIGLDPEGDIIYVAGPGLNPAELASVLISAGVAEGMQLDINPMFPLFSSYVGGVPTKLRPDMYYPADHYYSATERDFFAIFG